MTNRPHGINGAAKTEHFSPDLVAQVKKAVEILCAGGIVAFPTDTVYALGADIYNDEAVKKIFYTKNRPLNLPLPLLISEASEVAVLTSQQSAYVSGLMRMYWPGGLTIIFHKAPTFTSLAAVGTNKIGIRVPDHPVARLLIKSFGKPVVGTSANLHGKNTAVTAEEVRKQLGNQVDFIIDADPCPTGTESTIIDTTATPPVIVRKGMIPEKEIMALYYRQEGID